MSLRMIYGRAHSGKSDYILDKAHKLCLNNSKVIIVVPEQFTHIAEKRLISRIGSIEYGKAEVLSFNTMAKRINSIYPNDRKKLTSVARSLIMAQILNDTKLSYYRNASLDSGFIDVFMSEISEFKKYNVTCEDIISASGRVSDEGLSMKLRDLSEVYKSYEEVLTSGFADSDDVLNILSDNLTKYKPYSGYTFFFDEFSYYNPMEKKIISALSMQCDDLYMSLTLDMSDKYKYLFKSNLDTASSIISECSRCGCEVSEPVVLSDTYYINKEIEFLEKNMYAYPSEEYKDVPENIRVYSSENPYSEVRLLASQIKSLVKNSSVRYKDISVVCTDADMYSHIFRSVFSEYNIPYFLDEKTPVLRHSIICFALSVIDVYLYSYNAQSVTSFLKSGHMDIGRQDIINIDNFIRSVNISKNTYLSDERWSKILKKYCGDDDKLYNVIDNIRDKYIVPLGRLHDKIKGRNTVKYICEKLYDYFMDIGFDNNVSSYIEHFRDNGDIHMSKQYESVWKILIEAMDMLCFVMGDRQVNLTEFKKFISTALAHQQIGSIPSALDIVIISDIKRSKTDSAAYQFIVGACDGIFPSPSDNNVLISDSDKSELSSIGIELSPDSRQMAYSDRFLIYSSLSHPDKALVISYPASDTASNALRPSFTLTMLKNIFPKLKIKSSISDSRELMLSSEKTAMEYLAGEARRLSSGETPDGVWQDIYTYCKQNKSSLIDKINSYVHPAPAVYKLDKDLVAPLFKNEFYSTVSRIQKYNSCRYSYYIDYMLKLNDKKSDNSDAINKGNFVHAIMEQALKIIDAENISIADTDREYFSSLTDSLCNEYIDLLYPYSDELSPVEEFRLSNIKEDILSALMLVRTQLCTSAFSPIGYEISFDDDNYGCIELKLSDGKLLKLTGKIDRADSFENENGTYLRVIDYKTGNKEFNLSDIYHGLDMQLVVYLNALVKSTEHGHHAGAMYFQVKKKLDALDFHPDDDSYTSPVSGTFSGIMADEESCVNATDPYTASCLKTASISQLRLLSDYVHSRIIHSAESMSSGDITPNPCETSSGMPCDYCSYKSICGIDGVKHDMKRKLPSVNKNVFWAEIAKEGGESI